ncbi:MAG: hypothetical protein ACR2QF_09300 [Geminicoccaceae bacterium]
MNLDFLPGKKTYAVGFVMLAYGVLSGLSPELFQMVNIPPSLDAGRTIMEALAILTLRKGVARLET